MATEKQIKANRENSKQSTGPRTPAGKMRVAANAVKHGLTAKRLITLPSESRAELSLFRFRVMGDLKPVGMLQALFAEKISTDLWRAQRGPVFEASLLTRAYREELKTLADISILHYRLKPIREMMRAGEEGDEVLPGDREAHQEAKRRLEHARTAARDPSLCQASALEKCLPALSNLWRHERAIWKSVGKHLDKLQELQAARRAEPSYPAAEIDDDDATAVAVLPDEDDVDDEDEDRS